MTYGNLVIKDDYITTMERRFVRVGAELNSSINSYVDALTNIKSTAILSGETSKKIDSLITVATQLKDQIDDITSDCDDVLESFLSDINIADSYLF